MFGQGGCILAKVVVMDQKWGICAKVGVFGTKVVVFGQSGCIRARWFYSGEVVVLGQKWL